MRKYIILLVLFVLAIVGYNYIYKDHRNITTEQAEFTLNAESLFSQFSENPSNSEKKYLNKTIEVSGIITEFNEHNLVLNEKIFCLFQNPINTSITKDNFVKIKGRCIGYDDLLEEIKLDQCSFVDN